MASKKSEHNYCLTQLDCNMLCSLDFRWAAFSVYYSDVLEYK